MNDAIKKTTTNIPAQEQVCEARRRLEELDALIVSAIKVDILETNPGEELERDRILLELLRKLSEQTLAAAQIREDMTAGIKCPIESISWFRDVVRLFECWCSYLCGESSSVTQLAKSASAVAAHAERNSAALNLAGSVVSLLKIDGYSAELKLLPDGGQVVVWNDSNTAESASGKQ